LSYVIDLFNTQDVRGIVFVFCRVGTAFILLPGFSFARVPVIFRTLLAFVVSASAFQFLQAIENKNLSNGDVVVVILNELFIGLFFGFLCALFVYAVRFFAHFVSGLGYDLLFVIYRPRICS
jgi:flagellar biosynthesis protein FliR